MADSNMSNETEYEKAAEKPQRDKQSDRERKYISVLYLTSEVSRPLQGTSFWSMTQAMTW